MFRKIRRSKKEISEESAKKLLKSERRGVFAVNGDDGYPDEKTADEEIAQNGKAVQMFEIEIEHLSGKQIQEK